MPAAGAIVGAAGSLIGGKQQSDAAGNAANASAQGSRDSINAQVAMYNQSRADTLPQMVTGNSALAALANMYGLATYTGSINPGGIQVTGGQAETTKKKRNWFDKITDPANLAGQFGGTSYDPMGFFSSGSTTSTSPMSFGYGGGGLGTVDGAVSTGAGGGTMTPGTGVADFSQFYQTPDYLVAVQEGVQGLDRGAAANGRLYSGGADADRMTFASNLGSKAFGNYQNNLFRLAGLGSSANSELNSLGSNLGANVGNALTAAGNARASAYQQQGQAQSNALAGVGQAFGTYWGSRGG